jgi:hypothetical protein
MTEGERKVLNKAIADLQTGLLNSAPKSYLRIMAWQAKESLIDLLDGRSNDNLDTTRSNSNT